MEDLKNFNTGLIEEVPNIRDYTYSSAVCNNVTINNNFPETFQLNDNEMGVSIKDQGTVGACVACALSVLMEAFFQEEMSEGWIYGHLRDGYSNGTGMLLNKTLDYAKTLGGLPKKYFDLLMEMPTMRKATEDFPQYFEKAKNYTISNWVTIPDTNRKTGNAKDLAIKDALTKYRVPLICSCPKGFGASAHCLLIVGWDDKTDKYILKNSWGETSNNKGLVKVYKEDVKEVRVVFIAPLKLPFKDVNETDWFYESVKSCFMSGIIKGRTEDIFEPNSSITRAEIATIVSRIMKEIDNKVEALNDLIQWKHSYNKLDNKKE